MFNSERSKKVFIQIFAYSWNHWKEGEEESLGIGRWRGFLSISEVIFCSLMVKMRILTTFSSHGNTFKRIKKKEEFFDMKCCSFSKNCAWIAITLTKITMKTWPIISKYWIILFYFYLKIYIFYNDVSKS